MTSMPCPAPRTSRMRPSRHLALAGSVARPSRFVFLDMSFWDQKWMKFWRNLFFVPCFFKDSEPFHGFSHVFNRLDSKTTHLQLFETTAAPLSMTSSPLLGVHLARSCQKGHRGPWTEGFLVARPRRSFPGAQWRIWNPVVYYSYGHKH